MFSNDRNISLSPTSRAEKKTQAKKPVSKETYPRMKRRQYCIYDLEFKKVVVNYANAEGIRAANKRYNVSETNIRRWSKIHSGSLRIPTGRKVNEKEDVRGKKFVKKKQLDSMPLEHRLRSLKTPQQSSSNFEQHSLRSQALSPTRLKVTRQTKTSVTTPPLPPPAEPEVSLKWNNHHSNIQTMFPNLLLKEQYVDATLVAEGQTLKCHRVILSSSSPYFEEVFSSIGPFQHPVLFMKDTPFWAMKALCDFIYTGEVQILQTNVEELLAVAESFKIKGLCKKPDENEEAPKTGRLEPNVKQEPRVEEERRKFDAADVMERRQDLRERKHDKPEVKDKKIDRIEFKDRRKNQNAVEITAVKNVKQQPKVIPQAEIIPKFTKVLRSSTVQRKAVKSENYYDSYSDLLQPVYEEVQKEPRHANLPIKVKEVKTIPMKRGVRRIRKRKMSETREDSPAPVLSKRGTRSRPNRKIPKYYQIPSDIPRKSKCEESTIVHEPHTDQPDPLLHIENIKTEPLDETPIDIEDNVVCFNDDMQNNPQDEVSGNSESKKVCLAENEPKSNDMVKIVDVASIKSSGNEILEEDPLHFQNTSNITITNVQSLVENNKEETTSSNDNLNQVNTVAEFEIVTKESAEIEICKNNKENVVESCSGIKIANVYTENDNGQNKKEESLDDSQIENKDTINEISQLETTQNYFGDVSGNVSIEAETVDAITDISQNIEFGEITTCESGNDTIESMDFNQTGDLTADISSNVSFNETTTAEESGLFQEDSVTAENGQVPKIVSNDCQSIFMQESEEVKEIEASLPQFEQCQNAWEQSNCITEEESNFIENQQQMIDPTLPTLNSDVDYNASMVPMETGNADGCLEDQSACLLEKYELDDDIATDADTLEDQSTNFLEKYELDGGTTTNADQCDSVQDESQNLNSYIPLVDDDKIDFSEDNINFDDEEFKISDGMGQQHPFEPDTELDTIVSDLTKIVGESQD